ncbi:MAG: hypothetical protein J7L15_04125 [Clostridiales bacterium]|nr:hypothetical protein [Clostridiales bacterium]
MKLFETTWTTKGQNYIREYDTDLGKSVMRPTPHKSEYYLFDILGRYSSILDKNIKLRKVQGSAYNVTDAYGSTASDYVSIREEHFGKSSYNKNPGTFYLDIETAVTLGGFPEPADALEEIVLIQFFDTTSNKGYVLGLEEWTYRDDYKYDFDLEYIHCSDEHNLIHKYLELFAKLNPLIVTAWNGNGFDYPYLYNRMKRLGISVHYLSNYGNVKMKSRTLKNGTVTNDISAIGHIYSDMMEVYKKFVMETTPSYSLDYIGEKETGISKVNHDNYIKFDDFRIGKYKVLGNETDDQKAKLIHKCAVALETEENPNKIAKYKKYIKEKSYSEFVHYGVIDFVILKGIDESRNFTSLITSMAELMGCQLSDTMGTLKAWASYISNKALEENLIMPPKRNHGDPNIVGGFVRDPQKGKHEWILSSDVSSMYPLLSMAAFNMSGETFVPVDKRPPEVTKMIDKYFFDQNEDKLLEYTTKDWTEINRILTKYEYSLGINGAVFHQEFQGIIPKLVLGIYNARKAKKKEMIVKENLEIKAETPELKAKYKHESRLLFTGQLTDKLSINSLDGATGNKYFSLFNEAFAAAVTGNGRYFIKLLAKNVDNALQKMIPSKTNYVVAGDTDSIYFTIAPFIEKHCQNKSIEDKTEWSDRFYNKVIEKVVQETINEFSIKLNAYVPEHIGCDREVIADSALFVAKKKYTARVRDLEGKRYKIDEPYIKVTGLEIQQGGTAPFAKKYLKAAIPVILDKSESELKDWFQEVRAKYATEDLMSIAKTQGVSKLKDPNWGKVVNGRKVSIPAGSRACLVTNKYLEENNLQEQFPLISPGSKVKMLPLLQPNPFGNASQFAFEEHRFVEMFEEYIDRDIAFEKFFQKPLSNMIDVLGVDVTKNLDTLDEW